MTRKFLLISLLLMGALFSKAQQKYAIGMFHFNLQYVAGDYRIENRIITESLYPVLQFFDKNPKYRADIEIQGYAIEVLAIEHPQVLALFKKLINRGQIELVIAHYSDQFFIAYPALDLKKSIELSDQILAKYGMKRSRVFFGQEIQWTPAYASVLKNQYDLVVTSSDPHSHYRGKTLPLVNVKYGDDSILGLIGAGEKKLEGLNWEFSFLDDGEVFNTTDYRSNFYRVAEQEKESIDRFKKLEKEGFQFVTMTDLANKIKQLPGYKIPDYPFVPEGSWNMSVCGPFMWMGRQRSGVETDGITRALSYEWRGIVMMTEKVVDYAASQGAEVGEMRKLIKEAWEHLLLSEVSDASGWTPWLVEVKYTEIEIDQVERRIKTILTKLQEMAPEDNVAYLIETKSGKITGASAPKTVETAALLPIPVAIKAGKTEMQCVRLNDHLYRLDLSCRRPEDGAVEILFDSPASGMFYSAGAGEETAVEIPADLKNDPALALSNGFLYLGNGYSLVKDCSVEHLAVTWRQKEQKLVFREELNEKNPGMKMRFYLVKGDKATGLAFANQLNTWPTYLLKVVDKKISYEKVIPQ
ncbi:MAG: hypothetical protein LWW85_12865 [Marinilabiliales bacterium]|nr:hypothetical protein [Marinilabiliales bacterium]